MSETASRPSRRRYSVAHLILLIPWVALVVDAWTPIRDNSFLWHIRAGELQVDAGAVLQQDPFSFTMLGSDWLTQSWLAELGYSWAEDVSGLGFVPWMLLAMTLLTFLAVALISYRRSGSVMSTAIVTLLTTLSMISFLVPRPVIFSYVLFGLAILAWESPRTRWALPFVFWIWASVHGSFAIGLAYVGLSLIARREWRWLPTAIVSGLVTLATAHGLGVITMLLDFAEVGDTLSLLSEWQRPGLTSPVFLPFLAGLAIIAIGLVTKRLPWSQLWVVLPFAALGMTSLRAVPPAWLGLVPAVAMALGPLRAGTERRFSAGPAAVFAVVVLILPFLVRGDGRLSETRFPVAAAAELEPVNTFHDDRAGGYLIYAMGPEFGVYIDDRAELYGEMMAEFVAVRDLEEPWEPVFEREGIEQVLLPADSDLAAEVTAAGWQTTYSDDEFVVLRP
ncbi:MAG TPA: hypothetical protein VI141_07185 [Acidimicrobiia bacterium]